jgi:hypothetical protein
MSQNGQTISHSFGKTPYYGLSQNTLLRSFTKHPTTVFHKTPNYGLSQNTLLRSFAKHLATVFRPFPSQLTGMEEETILHELKVSRQMTLPLQKIRIHEVKNIIQHKTPPSKAPGYDLIIGKILQELSKKGLRAITQIYNAILRIEYFPCH